jgi:hypothetical protein
MVTIIFESHSTTFDNEDHLSSGHNDVELSELDKKQAIEDLMRELLTGEALEQGVKKFKKLYSELRSSFLHAGKLSGKEKEGGILFDFINTGDLMVNEMELIITCRQLFEQFLVKRQSS